VRVVARHRGFLRPRHACPAAAVATLGAVALAAPVARPARRALAAGLALYLGAAGVAAARAAPGAGLRERARVALAFTALHLGYGLGSLGEAPTLLAARRGRRSP
jgi:hypothetical protein